MRGPISREPVILRVPIIAGPLESHVEGHGEPMDTTLETGANYLCHVGMVETNINEGTEVAVMRIVHLIPPE